MENSRAAGLDWSMLPSDVLSIVLCQLQFRELSTEESNLLLLRFFACLQYPRADRAKKGEIQGSQNTTRIHSSTLQSCGKTKCAWKHINTLQGCHFTSVSFHASSTIDPSKHTMDELWWTWCSFILSSSGGTQELCDTKSIKKHEMLYTKNTKI